MRRAQPKDAATKEKFFFRKNVFPGSAPSRPASPTQAAPPPEPPVDVDSEYEEMTVNEILNGKVRVWTSLCRPLRCFPFLFNVLTRTTKPFVTPVSNPIICREILSPACWASSTRTSTSSNSTSSRAARSKSISIWFETEQTVRSIFSTLAFSSSPACAQTTCGYLNPDSASAFIHLRAPQYPLPGSSLFR